MREMPDRESLRLRVSANLLPEWYRIVHHPREALDWRDRDDFPYLQSCLVDPTIDLRDIALPPIAFGGTGDAVVILTTPQFLWFLPHIVLAMLENEGDGEFCYAFADAIIHKLGKNESNWGSIRGQLSDELIACLRSAADYACQFGWSDERRIRRRTEQCREIIG